MYVYIYIYIYIYIDSTTHPYSVLRSRTKTSCIHTCECALYSSNLCTYELGFDCAYMHTDRRTDRQTDRQTDGQTDIILTCRGVAPSLRHPAGRSSSRAATPNSSLCPSGMHVCIYICM